MREAFFIMEWSRIELLEGVEFRKVRTDWKHYTHRRTVTRFCIKCRKAHSLEGAFSSHNIVFNRPAWLMLYSL